VTTAHEARPGRYKLLEHDALRIARDIMHPCRDSLSLNRMGTVRATTSSELQDNLQTPVICGHEEHELGEPEHIREHRDEAQTKRLSCTEQDTAVTEG
jgi:hypothetical protein